MDPQPSSSRSTRRSYPNLHNLSLAPLSSAYPLDASQPPSPSSAHNAPTPMTSYIAQKSAPTTPGILSLSQSRSSSRTRDPNTRRRRSSKPYIYDSYFLTADAPVRDIGDIPKAKSTSSMHPGVSFADETPGRHHRRKGTAPLPLRVPLVRHHTSEAQDEWFHRAGLAIAGETRESKGQSWLVRRESSTSLVGGDGNDEHAHRDGRGMVLLSGEHLDDVEYNMPFTPRLSRAGSRIHSRVGSRVPSARNSRRGSRVNSRADLFMSPGGGAKTPSAKHSFEIDDIDERAFEQQQEGPDFVDDDESDGDEEEIARLARERGFGFGGWMDRLIGWTLFSVDEDGETSDDNEDEDDDTGSGEFKFRPENMTKEELRLRREVEAKRRRLERESIIAASALKGADTETSPVDGPEGVTGREKPPNEDAGGWQDAAWLFSVASKVIL